MPTVYLHVGATKTGTSYLQNTLSVNRERLAEQGVLWPGRKWSAQTKATKDLVNHPGRRGAPDVTGRWDQMVAQIHAHGGPAIMSMEFLSFADEAAAERAARTLAPLDIRVILTARDLWRVTPAIWQESVQNSNQMPYREYLDKLTKDVYPVAETGMAKAFWGQQDLARILRVWGGVVKPDNLVVVTVPPKGADRSLLLDRFCEAAHIDHTGFAPARTGNESLGATSTEVVRRVNKKARQWDADFATFEVIKWRVSKRYLSNRTARDQVVGLPERYRPWVAKSQDRLIEAMAATNPTVIGSLDELRVPRKVPRRMRKADPRTRTDPAAIPTEQVLDAAIEAILYLSADIAGSPFAGQVAESTDDLQTTGVQDDPVDPK